MSSATKANTPNERRLVGGAIEWTDVDELITEILGRESISLVSTVGGIDAGDKIQASEHTVDASSDVILKDSLLSTS